MQVRPVRDFLLIQPEPQETKTSGGILLPQNAKTKHLVGKVLAVGPGRVTDSGRRVEVVDVRVGDKVIVGSHTMAQAVSRLGGDDGPMLVPEMDVIAVIES